MPRTLLAGLICGALGLNTACGTSTVAARPSPFPGAIVVNAPPRSTKTRAIPSSPVPALETALALRGVPYRLGGDDPQAGFDCSGLVRYAFAGSLALPRTVAEQFRVGQAISRDKVSPGDLVFFTTAGAAGPSHVGIALDDAQFIHAPVSDGVVRVERWDAPYWRDRFVGARRVR